MFCILFTALWVYVCGKSHSVCHKLLLFVIFNLLTVVSLPGHRINAIMELYQLTQTISSPTRVTMTSSSLLDVCITHTPEKLVTSRVVPVTISDHYLILTIRKINIHPNQIRNKKIEIRSFKHFNAENFINDLQDQRWDLCDGDFSVDKKWKTWKSLFSRVLDKHTPIRIKNVRNKSNVPWQLGSLVQLNCKYVNEIVSNFLP